MSSLKVAAAIGAMMASTTIQANPLTLRDDPVMEPLPECSPEEDLKWQPAMDFDKDGCYNHVAVDIYGTLNPGMDNCYTGNTDGCRGPWHLTDSNNVYSRERCNNGWCVYVYGYYFPKDVNLEHVCGVGAGHRHDWEHVAVFVQHDGGSGLWVAVSQHGGWELRDASSLRWDGETHPKVVYHREGAQTHSFRFAEEGDDDPVENHTGAWYYGDLVSWNGWPSEDLRNAVSDNDWGSASFALKDSSWQSTIDGAKEEFADQIGIDASFDEDSPKGTNCTTRALRYI